MALLSDEQVQTMMNAWRTERETEILYGTTKQPFLEFTISLLADRQERVERELKWRRALWLAEELGIESLFPEEIDVLDTELRAIKGELGYGEEKL